MLNSLPPQEQFSKIRLRPAYAWDCPDCGREVFERGVVPEMSEEDMEELREQDGVGPLEEGDFVMMPETVECPHCHSRFATVHFRDEAEI
jgi:hypothetical protein